MAKPVKIKKDQDQGAPAKKNGKKTDAVKGRPRGAGKSKARAERARRKAQRFQGSVAKAQYGQAKHGRRRPRNARAPSSSCARCASRWAGHLASREELIQSTLVVLIAVSVAALSSPSWTRYFTRLIT